MPPASWLLFLVTLSLSIFSTFLFYGDFFFFSNSVKNAIGISMGLALNVQAASGNMFTFTQRILLVLDGGKSLYLLVSSVSFSVVLQFQLEVYS